RRVGDGRGRDGGAPHRACAAHASGGRAMTWWQGIAAILLLMANGFFVWSEFATVAVRRTRREELAEDGDRRARVALGLGKELTLVLGGTQLGITMASLGLGFVAEPLVGHLLEEVFDPASGLPLGLRHALSYALALAIVVF